MWTGNLPQTESSSEVNVKHSKVADLLSANVWEWMSDDHLSHLKLSKTLNIFAKITLGCVAL